MDGGDQGGLWGVVRSGDRLVAGPGQLLAVRLHKGGGDPLHLLHKFVLGVGAALRVVDIQTLGEGVQLVSHIHLLGNLLSRIKTVVYPAGQHLIGDAAVGIEDLGGAVVADLGTAAEVEPPGQQQGGEDHQGAVQRPPRHVPRW